MSLYIHKRDSGSSLHGRVVLDQKDNSDADGCKQTSHTNYNNLLAVNGPIKDPWARVLLLSGTKVVCRGPHLAGTIC